MHLLFHLQLHTQGFHVQPALCSPNTEEITVEGSRSVNEMDLELTLPVCNTLEKMLKIFFKRDVRFNEGL